MKIEIGEGGFGSTLAMVMVVGFFIPALWVVLGVVFFLMWIAGLCADAQVKQAMKADSSSKIVLHVPELTSVLRAPKAASPTASALSDEESNAIIEAALAETNRQMEYVICPDPRFRERYFDTVFTRLCERQGLKVDKFFWKSIEG